MAFRQMLLLAAVIMMLLVTPLVKSVPTDYVASDEQPADVAPAGEPNTVFPALSSSLD
jgi:hypothetical protein